MKQRFEKLGSGVWLLGPLAVCFSMVLLVAHAAGRPLSPAGVTLFVAGVIAAYAFDFWADHPAQHFNAVLWLAGFATMAGLMAACWLPLWKVALAAALGLAGLTYRRWKKWPLGKTFLIAGAWTAASIGFPVEWDARDLLLSPFGGALFALFAADALLCDLKDGSADARTGVRSAVVLWGQPVTTILAGGLALTGLAAALAVGRLGLAGAGLALAVLAMCPKLVTRPVLGPALVDGALVLPAVLILAGLA